MSETSNQQPLPKPQPESDFQASDSAKPDNLPDVENDPASNSVDIARPDLEDTSRVDQTVEPSISGLGTASPDSEDHRVIRNHEQTPSKTDDPPPRQRVYVVSSAEPDWSGFTMLPLEDIEIEPVESGSGWKTVWAIVREVGETVILTLIIFLLIQTVIRNFRVVGTSMVDNLHNGQYLIIDKLSYNPWITNLFSFGGPQRGDVIVFEPPNRPGEDYVKRIIALPGETIEIDRGQVLINGKPLDEAFQPRTGTYSMPALVVPPGQVFVLGDNRNNSNDSHNWGALPIDNIVGRAWVSYWPPELWGTIPRDQPAEKTTLRNFIEHLVPSASAEEH